MYKKIGIIGLGFVGSAIFKSFKLKHINVIAYDKYKSGGIGSFDEMLKCDLLFLCLPTLFIEEFNSYNKASIHEVCQNLDTYKYKGLPPGPICLPSINAIDAVLNSDSHNFVFMCAKEDFSGYHNFAKTYAKHLINARKYQKALNKKNIKR